MNAIALDMPTLLDTLASRNTLQIAARSTLAHGCKLAQHGGTQPPCTTSSVLRAALRSCHAHARAWPSGWGLWSAAIFDEGALAGIGCTKIVPPVPRALWRKCILEVSLCVHRHARGIIRACLSERRPVTGVVVQGAGQTLDIIPIAVLVGQEGVAIGGSSTTHCAACTQQVSSKWQAAGRPTHCTCCLRPCSPLRTNSP